MFTNIYITSIYLIPLLALIATITINFINLDYYIDMIVTVTLISVAGLAFFLSLFIGGVLVKIASILSGVSFSNAFYLVHSKYLIDKFAHFYNIDLNHIINNYLGKLNEFELISSKYLKTKDKSQLTINENPKNRGIIFRVYSKNKSKAIKLMELNIKYFFHITQ